MILLIYQLKKIERKLANKQAQPKTLKVMYGLTAAAVLMFGVFTTVWQQKTRGLDNALNFLSFGSDNIEQNDHIQSDIIVGQSTVVTENKPLEITQLNEFFNKEEFRQ